MNIASRSHSIRTLIALSGGLLCALLSWFEVVEPLDWLAYDISNKASPIVKADDIVIVAIDERSLLEFGRWPWPREKHVELIRRLTKLGAAVIAIDIVFSEPDTENPKVDELLAQAIRAHGAVVLPVFIGKANGGRLLEVKPIESMADAASALGHVHIEVNMDGVARTVYLQEGIGTPRWNHFAVAIANLLGLQTNELPGVRSPIAPGVFSPGSILRDRQNLIPFMGPAGTVDRVSYMDVLTDRLPDNLIRGKIILVGATAAGHVDNITTSLGQIPGVEVNANIFHSLREGVLARPVRPANAAAITFLFTAIAIFVLTLLKPRPLLFAVFGSVIIVPIAGWAILRWYHLWISPVPIVLSLLLSYPMWNWLRLDATVKFIRRQLQSLERENYPLRSRTGWDDLQRRSEFLKILGHLEHWDLQQTKEPLGNKEEPQSPWQHTDLLSEKTFTLEGNSRTLVLQWLRGHEHFATQLPLIFPEAKAETTATADTDMINMDLAMLEDAYSEARHNRDLIKGSLEQLSSGVILANLDGQVLLINRQAQNLLSITQGTGNIISVLAYLEFKGAPSIAELISGLLLRDDQFNLEGNSIRGGHNLLCRGRLVKLDRPIMLFTLTDVSELKRSEGQRAEALNFLSHDLRAPLTSVLALIEGAKHNSPGHFGPELLNEIEGYILRNLAYAEDYVQLSRLAHTESVTMTECDARSILDNAVRQIYHRAQQQSIKIIIKYCDEDISITGNPAWLERGLVNLLDNALKHGPDDSTITARLECDTKQSYFRISDQGPGISDEEISHIFDQFTQGIAAQTGVGLGLHFVTAVAKAHGGEILVTNNPEGGACFSLSVPHPSHGHKKTPEGA